MMRAALCVVLAGCCSVSQAGGGEFTSRSSPVDLLRAYSYASCVASAYANTETGNDAQRIAESLREALPNTQPEVFAALREYASRQQPGTPAVSNNANFGLLRCLELFNSAELKKVVRKEMKRGK